MLAKSDIIVYIPTYQDRDAVSNNLDHLEKLGLKALVGDSRFTDFAVINESDFSTDGTKEMVLQRGHHWFEMKPCREEQKLNQAMQIASTMKYKVFIYIGADAYLDGDIDEFLINLTREYEKYVVGPSILLIEAVELQPDSKWNNTSTRQPRILFNYGMMEARHLHWVMYEKGSDDTDPLVQEQVIVSGLKIFHDNSVRPKQRDDLMTIYQNKNVPRERKMYEQYVAKKAYDVIDVMQFHLDETPYSKARQHMMSSDKSHLIIAKKGIKLTDRIVSSFIDALNQRNSVLYNVAVLTAVYDVDGDRFTMDKTGKYLDNLPDYPAVRKMYCAEGISPIAKFMGIAWTTGPIICMDKETVKLIDNIGDELDFMTFCNQLGIVTEAVTDIRI